MSFLCTKFECNFFPTPHCFQTLVITCSNIAGPILALTARFTRLLPSKTSSAPSLQLLRLTFAIILHTPQRGLVWAARVALWCIPSMWCILALWCILSSDQRWNLQPAEVTRHDSAYCCHTRHVSHIHGIKNFFNSWYLPALHNDVIFVAEIFKQNFLCRIGCTQYGRLCKHLGCHRHCGWKIIDWSNTIGSKQTWRELRLSLHSHFHCYHIGSPCFTRPSDRHYSDQLTRL